MYTQVLVVYSRDGLFHPDETTIVSFISFLGRREHEQSIRLTMDRLWTTRGPPYHHARAIRKVHTSVYTRAPLDHSWTANPCTASVTYEETMKLKQIPTPTLPTDTDLLLSFPWVVIGFLGRKEHESSMHRNADATKWGAAVLAPLGAIGL